jgi:hypothetical protein
MDKKLITDISFNLKSFGRKVLLVENPDEFLKRKDVIAELLLDNIKVVPANNLDHRIAFELRNELYPNHLLALVSDDNSNYLQDILDSGMKFEFHFSDYFKEYHISTIKDCNLDVLERIYNRSQLKNLNKSETEDLLRQIVDVHAKTDFNYPQFKKEIEKEISKDNIDWHFLIEKISLALRESVGSSRYDQVFETINKVNDTFQEEINNSYKQYINSSSVNRPKVVSSILDHISFSSKAKKVALLVIDGMAWWQYQMLKTNFPETFQIKEQYTYAWLPSITQLSRQAIFRGARPFVDYRQNPSSEEKLWKEYWTKKGLNKFEIRYNHQETNFKSLDRVSKLAIVYKDLDDKMHSSSDYLDLKGLTKNWLERTEIISKIKYLLENRFEVYITTDHGNLPARGWRGLNGREKLGTNKSGSRSQRHLEYSDKRLAEDFLKENPELKASMVQEDHLLYFKDDLSFSRESKLITHGGSHILEVLIPFVKISL